jgi:hypothetical protein
MAAFFAETGVEGLSRMNKLTVEENRELFRSRDLVRVIELILEGLARG